MRTLILTTALFTLIACDKSSEPASTTPADGTTETTDDAAAPAAEATEPDRDKLVLHIREHLELPADKAKIMEACAQTPEFTEGEKQWVADHLPEGTYESPDDVIAAMGLAED